MAVDYKKIGLVNTKDMFARAIKGGWAVPAFNFNNLEQMQAIIQASSNLKSPVILQVSKGARKYANPTLLRYLAEGAVEYAKDKSISTSIGAVSMGQRVKDSICRNLPKVVSTKSFINKVFSIRTPNFPFKYRPGSSVTVIPARRGVGFHSILIW